MTYQIKQKLLARLLSHGGMWYNLWWKGFIRPTGWLSNSAMISLDLTIENQIRQWSSLMSYTGKKNSPKNLPCFQPVAL